MIRILSTYGTTADCQLGQIKLFAAPHFELRIMHEKLNHRINYEDGIAEITKRGGRPLTREELRDFMNGKPLYPGEIQWTPIWVDDRTKKPDWMQIGEGEGDAGTSWLERSGGSYLSRHTDAGNNAHGSHDWNVTVVYWGRVFSKTLDIEEEYG